MGTLTDRLVRWGGMRLSRRFARSLPLIGVVVAGAGIAAAVRKKGLVGGVVDSGLNAVPFVGAAKNVLELTRGRDFIRDRQPA
jgi:hypothetical protein